MPKISVIMPAYNAEKYIAEAVESILGQTFDDFEFIIINDCSQDRTEEIILSYDDPRIIYLKNEQNLGVAATLNKGLAIAKGEYIARMDADDISMPERFEKQAKFLDKKRKIVACGSATMLFGETQEQTVRIFPTNPQRANLQLIFAPCFAHPSVMIRREILKEYALFYDECWEGTEDFALWWELGKKGRLVALREALLYYRMHTNQVTANSGSKIEKIFLPFAFKRLKDLNVDCNMSDAEALFAYTSGRLNPEQAEKFIYLMKKIAESPESRGRFGSSPLRRYLAIEILGAIDSLEVSQREKNKLYHLAKKAGFKTKALRIKRDCSRALRRIL